MPIDQLDPRTLLLGLQPQARTPYDAPDLVAERRARVEQLREAAKAKQQKEYEAQVYDWAIKSNLGPDGTPDIPAVAKALYGVSAPFGDHFMTAVRTARKATADTYDLEDKHRTNQVTLLGQSAANTDQTNYSDNFQNWKALGLQPEQFGLGPTWTPDTPTRLKAVGDAATTIPEQHKAKQDAIDHFVKGDFLQGAAQYVQARGANLTDGDVVDLTKRMTQFGAHPEEVRTVMDQTPEQLQAWAPGVIEGPAKVAELAGQAESRAETKRQNDLQEAARQRADADRKAAAEAKAVMDADLLRHRRVIENKPTGGAGAALGTRIQDDPDALDYVATQYRVLGPQGIPTRLGEADKVAIIKQAAAQTKALGQSPAVAVQRQAAYKGDAASLTKMKTMAAAAESFENKANQQAEIVNTLSTKVGRTGSPMLNSWLLAGKKDVAGDTDTALLYNAIQTFSTEYAKIMEGSTGSVSGSTESARRAAEQLIKATLAPATIPKVVSLMQREMALTRTGYDATIEHITTRMGGTVQPEAAPDVPPQVLAAGPGLHTFANGQQWDVAPDGKSAKRIK